MYLTKVTDRLPQIPEDNGSTRVLIRTKNNEYKICLFRNIGKWCEKNGKNIWTPLFYNLEADVFDPVEWSYLDKDGNIPKAIKEKMFKEMKKAMKRW